ncbi:MAG: multiheme c-type cytochrome [Pirellulales bacterium]
MGRNVLLSCYLMAYCAIIILFPGRTSFAQSITAEKTEYTGYRANCGNCHAAQELRIEGEEDAEEEQLSAWVKSPMFDDWDKHDLHKIAHRAVENDRGQEILERLGNTAGMKQECLACHGTPKDKTAFPIDDIQSVKFDSVAGVSCEACHGPYRGWDVIHRESGWRTLPSAEKEKVLGFVDMRNPLSRAEKCVSCHIGSVAEGKLVTHAMYVAGHPPLSGFDVQGYLQWMPQHWENMRDKAPHVQLEQEAAGLWRRDELVGSRAAFVGLAVSLRANLEALASVATESTLNEPSYYSWPELGLMECSSCHHDLRQESWRRDPVRMVLRHQPGNDRAPAVGRPCLPTSSRVALMAPPVLDVWKSSHEASEIALAMEQLNLALDELDAEFRAHPFGNPKRVESLARVAGQKADELAILLNEFTLLEPTAVKLTAALAELGREQHLSFDESRQIVWTFDQLHRDLKNNSSMDTDIRAREEILASFGRSLNLTGNSPLDRILPEGNSHDWLTGNSLLDLSVRARNRFEDDDKVGPSRVIETWHELLGGGIDRN